MPRGEYSLPLAWAELRLSLDRGWPVAAMGTVDSQSVDSAGGICNAGSVVISNLPALESNEIDLRYAPSGSHL